MLKFFTFLSIYWIVFWGGIFFSNAQEKTVQYPDLIIDSDLDGLTDEGERQIYGTDAFIPDSDGDGFLDGVEVLSGSDPLDKSNRQQENDLSNEIPWAWYSVRAVGLVGFGLLYLSIFFGLFVRIPFARNMFGAIETINFHRWFSLQAMIFIFFHGFLLTFDYFYKFSLMDVFVPFYSSFNPLLMSLGTFGFYLMIILVITSYFRNKISNRIWRIVHYFNIVLYVFVAIHAHQLGTDLKIEWVRYVFYLINIILVILVFSNIFYRIKNFNVYKNSLTKKE